MKWFYQDYKPANTPQDQAKNIIEYLKKSGDRPEKWASVRRLFLLISKKKLNDALIQETIELKWNRVNYRIASLATEAQLQMLLDSDLLDQKLFAIMILNKSLTQEQAKQLYQKCDDSDRGTINKKQLERKFGLVKDE
jgi:hypothetical protein